MKLIELCRSAAIDCPREKEHDEVLSIAADSALITEKSLFVCIRGLRVDGHDYIADAISRGARWIVVEEGYAGEKIRNVTYLTVKNTRRAWSYLCNQWYGDPCSKLKMIGVTGTNGKTTVTHMIREILSKQGVTCGMIGTLGCYLGDTQFMMDGGDPLANMTTPDPQALYRALSMMAEQGAECVVMEVSSHALALERVAPIRFSIAIFTNLTPEHLDFHETMEEYANAKASLLANCDCAIVNADSPYAERMISAVKKTLRLCSVMRNDTAYSAKNVFISDMGVTYTLYKGKERKKVSCPIGGSFTVDNSMQAIACAAEMGVPLDRAAEAIATMRGVKGRMERVLLPKTAEFSVWIDYAHTPDALKNLLIAAQRMRNEHGRLILLFGCGGDRDRKKRPQMGMIASQYADLTVITTDNSRSEDKYKIIREILAGISLRKPCAVIADRREAIENVMINAERGDVILLAGKGHEEYEIDADGRHFFSERQIVLDAYAKRIQKQHEEGAK